MQEGLTVEQAIFSAHSFPSIVMFGVEHRQRTKAVGGMHRQHQCRALQTSDARGRQPQSASQTRGWSDGGRKVLPKDFDVSETPFCYPLEIARWPCDLPHVTAESLILLCPGRGKQRLANSYITEIHSWQRQPGSPTPLRRGSTRVLPCGPQPIGQSASFVACARLILLALLHRCTRRPSSWR